MTRWASVAQARKREGERDLARCIAMAPVIEMGLPILALSQSDDEVENEAENNSLPLDRGIVDCGDRKGEPHPFDREEGRKKKKKKKRTPPTPMFKVSSSRMWPAKISTLPPWAAPPLTMSFSDKSKQSPVAAPGVRTTARRRGRGDKVWPIPICKRKNPTHERPPTLCEQTSAPAPC